MKIIWIAGYAVMAIVSARIFYTVAFKADYEDSVKKGYGPEEKRLYYARHFGNYFAWTALFWPIAWPALVIVWIVTRPTGIEKDIEKRKAEEEAAEERERRIALDMQRLRAHYKSVGDYVPDNVFLRKIAENRVKHNEDVE